MSSVPCNLLFANAVLGNSPTKSHEVPRAGFQIFSGIWKLVALKSSDTDTKLYVLVSLLY
jgi:hypothetical protein